MRDPIATYDGQIYDHDNIKEWFKTRETSPATGLRLNNKLLIDETRLKERIKAYLETLGARSTSGSRPGM